MNWEAPNKQHNDILREFITHASSVKVFTTTIIHDAKVLHGTGTPHTTAWHQHTYLASPVTYHTSTSAKFKSFSQQWDTYNTTVFTSISQPTVL